MQVREDVYLRFLLTFLLIFFVLVLLVGYGTENVNGINIPYWLIKNSWGPRWGLSGYMKILRNNSNICGVMSAGVFPVIV